ncbi:hypothetical protein Bbelb_085320 [Branchiostoma belcheri]|nr:hypothetical protein Bbelb_085320 [Branchiostoma belcheri]
MDTIVEEVLEEDRASYWEDMTRRISPNNLLRPPRPTLERRGSLEEERFLVFPDQDCEELYKAAPDLAGFQTDKFRLPQPIHKTTTGTLKHSGTSFRATQKAQKQNSPPARSFPL